MNSVLPRTPAPLSRVLGLFSVLLISAALLPGLQAQQAMVAAYHVMTTDGDGNIGCQMMSAAAAADLGLIPDHQTRSLQPLEISPQQGGGGQHCGHLHRLRGLPRGSSRFSVRSGHLGGPSRHRHPNHRGRHFYFVTGGQCG